MELHIELIPEGCWNINLSTNLKRNEWDKIRKKIYKKQSGKCHICNEKSYLDAHEVWDYDEENHIQKLKDIVGVCKKCHNAIHFKRAQRTGFQDEAVKQLMKVNYWDISYVIDETVKAKEDYDRRSQIKDWTLDISMLEKQGVKLLLTEGAIK